MELTASEAKRVKDKREKVSKPNPKERIRDVQVQYPTHTNIQNARR